VAYVLYTRYHKWHDISEEEDHIILDRQSATTFFFPGYYSNLIENSCKAKAHRMRVLSSCTNNANDVIQWHQKNSILVTQITTTTVLLPGWHSKLIRFQGLWNVVCWESLRPKTLLQGMWFAGSLLGLKPSFKVILFTIISENPGLSEKHSGISSNKVSSSIHCSGVKCSQDFGSTLVVGNSLSVTFDECNGVGTMWPKSPSFS